jgi:hypothetical protein
MEKVNQYFTDRKENFDDYYPYVKSRKREQEDYNLLHIRNWILFFVYIYYCTTRDNRSMAN